MRGNEMLDNMELVDAAYVEAADTHPKNKIWMRWVALAACLSLIVAGGMLGSLFYTPDLPDDSILSYFVITAQAANGESTELSFTSSCINSGKPNYNLFGHDMPLFHFDIKPSNLENNEAVYQRFDISISYNGTTVAVKDEHISVAYLASAYSSQTYGYTIFGWFTEPTDILVSIMDKESREIVETITVRVTYLEDRQEYELEITNLTTKFAEQKQAVEASNALMQYFYDQGYVTDYPDYFGGCYIENNKLYIKLVSPTDDQMKAISAILAPYNDVVVYLSSEMSMSDLQAYADKTADELISHGYAVTSWYVDSMTGNIVIEVLEKDLAAATARVADMTDNRSVPNIIIMEGDYISLD